MMDIFHVLTLLGEHSLIQVDAYYMKDIEKLAVDFGNGKYDYNVKDEMWPVILEYISENSQKFIFDKSKIHTLWTVNSGHLRRKFI